MATWLAAAPAVAAGTEISSWYRQLSIPVPLGGDVVICHGFNCYARTPVALGEADRRTLAGLVRGSTPDAERRGIARAVAWFDKRVGRETGTTRAKAFARGMAGDTSQYDCVDRATNTTSLFLMLSGWGLLRHHNLKPPESRTFIPIVEGPHTTAVLEERRSGRTWAVDPWTRNFGELPEIMPLAVWHEQKDRPGYFSRFGL